jgi:hypothetical protein
MEISGCKSATSCPQVLRDCRNLVAEQAHPFLKGERNEGFILHDEDAWHHERLPPIHKAAERDRNGRFDAAVVRNAPCHRP